MTPGYEGRESGLTAVGVVDPFWPAAPAPVDPT